MSKFEFGTYDLFQWNAIEAMPEPADFYDQHLSEVQLAENVGFDYHFIIEHQGNNIGQCSAPLVYLSALAQRTSTIRFGAMIFPTFLQSTAPGPRRSHVGPAIPRALGVWRRHWRVGTRIYSLEHSFPRKKRNLSRDSGYSCPRLDPRDRHP